MRVLAVMETLGTGGAERALLPLLPALGRRGHECEVAVLRPPLDLAEPLRALGIKVHELGQRHRWDLPRGIAGLRRLAADADVVHAHNFFPGAYSALTAPVARRPVRVMTFHNLGYESFPATTVRRRARKQFDALLMRHGVDVHLAVSGAVAEHYAGHLHLPSVEVVHNGFDLAALARLPGDAAERAASLGVEAGMPTLVAVGRMVPEKAYEGLVAAAADLRARGIAFRLLVVGDGPRRDEVTRAVRSHGLTEQVVLLGTRPHDDVRSLLAAADVYVLSSTHEGFPLAPAEAMAVGTPVVATAVGGVPELVGPAGVLVPPSRPAELAAAVAELLADDERRTAMAAAGRAQVARFDVDAVAARLDAVYRAAVARHRAAVR